MSFLPEISCKSKTNQNIGDVGQSGENLCNLVVSLKK
jgi:hypothetical protein